MKIYIYDDLQDISYQLRETVMIMKNYTCVQPFKSWYQTYSNLEQSLLEILNLFPSEIITCVMDYAHMPINDGKGHCANFDDFLVPIPPEQRLNWKIFGPPEITSDELLLCKLPAVYYHHCNYNEVTTLGQLSNGLYIYMVEVFYPNTEQRCVILESSLIKLYNRCRDGFRQ